MPETVHEQVVKWRVDSTTASAAQRSVEQLSRRYAELKVEMQRLQGEARDATKAFRSQTGDINAIAQKTLALKKTTAELRDTERELSKALSESNAEYAERENLAKRLSQERRQRENLGASARLYGDVESRTRAITGAVGYFGGEGFERQVNFGAEALSSVEAVKLLKLELPDLAKNLGVSTAALGAMGAAALVAFVAFQKVKDIIKASGEEVRAYLKYQQEFFELIKTGTESELRAALEEKRQALEIARARQDDIKAMLAQEDKVKGLSRAFIELDDALNLNVNGSRDLEKAGDELGGEITELERQIRTLEGAMGAGATAATDYKARIEEQAQAMVDAAAMVGNVLATATPDTFASVVDQLEEEIRAREIQRDLLQPSVTAGEVAREEAQQAEDAIAALMQSIVTGPDITPEQRTANQQAMRNIALQRENLAYNQQIRDDLIAQGDAAQAQIDVLEAEIATRRKSLDGLEAHRQGIEAVGTVLDEYNRSQAIARDSRTMTRKQAEDELEQNRRQQEQTLTTIDRLKALGLENDVVRKSVENLTDEYDRLVDREYQLTEAIIPAIDARDLENDRIKQLTENLQGLGKALGGAGQSLFYLNQQGTADRKGARFSTFGKDLQEENDTARARLEAVAEFKREAIELEEDRLIKLRQGEEDFLRQRTQDLADHYTDLARLDQNYFEDRATLLDDLAQIATEAEQERIDALKEANTEAQREAEDHQDRIQDIMRDTRRDAQYAASRGDAVALRQAQLRAQDALEDENEQYEKERDRREEDFRDRLQELDDQRRENERAGRERLADLQRQHAQERTERIADFNQKLAREDQERTIELQRETDAWNLENNRRQQSLLDQQNMTSQAFLNIYNTVDSGWTSIENRFAVGMAALGGLAPAGVGGALAGLGGIPAFDHGGEMPRTGIAHLKQGEWIMVPEVAQAAKQFVGGQLTQQSLLAAMKGAGTAISIPVNIQTDGLSQREIARLETLIPQRIEAVMTELFQEIA